MPIKPQTQDGLLAVHQIPEGERIRVALEGELDLSNAETAEAALLAAFATEGDVLVDLGRLAFIDSTGIALLVTALRERESGLRFLPSAFPEVRRLLSLTGLDERMEFITTAEPFPGKPLPRDEDLARILPAA